MKTILLGASSDIGTALASHWLSLGWDVHGTYRSHTTNVTLLETKGMASYECDLCSKNSVNNCINSMETKIRGWDSLVLSSGLLHPVGLFEHTEFHDWEKSIDVNFLRPMYFLHKLLPFAKKNAKIIFFAGGGTNRAVTHYSAYTISKIALIKMCEFLSAEQPDKRYIIIGPGWVDTKIHADTLLNQKESGSTYEQYQKIKASDQWTPMEDVINCCTWAITSECDAITGRNISVVHDSWKNKELETSCVNNFDLFKLRRME